MPDELVERVGITGHQDLPAPALELLQRRLEQWFQSTVRMEAVCSLAIGADSVVAEHFVARGGSLHAIIPCQKYGETFTTSRELEAFESLLGRAETVETLGFDKPSEEAFMAAGSLVARSCDWLLAVWDGEHSRGLGGTGDVVEVARSLGKPVRIVWPVGVTR